MKKSDSLGSLKDNKNNKNLMKNAIPEEKEEPSYEE